MTSKILMICAFVVCVTSRPQYYNPSSYGGYGYGTTGQGYGTTGQGYGSTGQGYGSQGYGAYNPYMYYSQYYNPYSYLNSYYGTGGYNGLTFYGKK